MRRYNPKDVEPKWQKAWADKKLYRALDFDSKRPKYVMLTEFPYPSGDGLHMGHVREYTLGDIIARHKRMSGHNVLYPMGYDAFGLPTENYAIKHKIAPQKATEQNVGNFQKQFDSLGYSIDWDRSFKTTDPSYYKWTQWLFLQFYKAGLAYQDEIAINWCPKCKTGLANEEVINGTHERCDTPVEKKTLTQWMLRITDYAQRLIDGLETVDYPSRIAEQQINWIGKSKGAEIDFAVNANLSGRNFLFLHGYGWDENGAFWPWLKEEVEKRGGKVTVYSLPNTKNPNVDEQAKYAIDRYDFDEHTTIVTHSLGGCVAMKLIPQLSTKIDHLIMVAPPLKLEFKDNKPRPHLEKVCDWKFDFKAIKKNTRSITVLREENDHIIPDAHPQILAEELAGNLVDGKGAETHFDGKKEPVVLSAVIPTLSVFTTRPDTLFGATFMVLAPEHPLVEQIVASSQKAAVEKYVKQAQAKSEIERQDTDREKTGVFSGAYATNPVNSEKIPIWIADYVLMGYGTGAIMAVPAHDERDYEFAKKFELPITQVIMSCEADPSNPPKDGLQEKERSTVVVHLRDKSSGKFALLNWHGSLKGITTAIMGGVEAGQSPEQAALSEIKEEAALDNVKIVHKLDWITASRYCASHKGINRRAITHGFVAEVDNLNDQGSIAAKEQKLHTLVWADKKDVASKLTPAHQKLIWEQLWHQTALDGEGELINSGKYSGMSSSEARDKIVADLSKSGMAKEKVNYRLRDWIFSRQHYWGEPIPIIHCDKCGSVPVPEDQLPIELPDVDRYEPTDTGESPLAYIADWVNVACPKCDGPAKRETDTMPNWAGSSWYYLRYYDARNDEAFADRKNLDYWGAVDMYLGGMEHTTLHLLYSRFWHQFFYDQGLAPTPEPYQARRGQGIILAPDGAKMSKSKGNVVNPTDIIDQGYGADALRMAITFVAPFDQTTAWNPEIVAGTFRYLQRVWVLIDEFNQTSSDDDEGADQPDNEVLRTTHKAIKKVSHDLLNLSFNTAISALMEMTNELYKIKATNGFAAKSSWQTAFGVQLKLLAPFAPHMTEELWHSLGNKQSIHVSDWPLHDDKYLQTDSITIVVQVNGKVRANIEVSTDSSEEQVVEAAKKSEKVATHLAGQPVKKSIYVPGKLVNFVV